MSATLREQIETVRAMQRHCESSFGAQSETAALALAALLRIVEKVGETDLRVRSGYGRVATWVCEECDAFSHDESMLVHRPRCLEPERRALRRAIAAQGGEGTNA